MKTIAFIGASGYGNIGDDTYPLVFRQYLGKQFKLQFYNSDLPKEAPKADLYVFGGGGLIWHQEGNAHLEYMKRYATWAKQSSIPYIFCSCGIQPRHNKLDTSSRWNLEPIKKWKSVLKDALSITVRSEADKKIIQEISQRDVVWFPDLGYLFRPNIEINKKQYTIWTPAASGRATNPVTAQIIKERLSQKKNIYALNMGGPSQEHLIEEAVKIFPSIKLVVKQNLSPIKCFSLIANSCEVIAGRYHSLVFSRSAGVSYWINKEYAQFKIENENINSNPDTAIKHIEILRSFLEK